MLEWLSHSPHVCFLPSLFLPVSHCFSLLPFSYSFSPTFLSLSLSFCSFSLSVCPPHHTCAVSDLYPITLPLSFCPVTITLSFKPRSLPQQPALLAPHTEAMVAALPAAHPLSPTAAVVVVALPATHLLTSYHTKVAAAAFPVICLLPLSQQR